MAVSVTARNAVATDTAKSAIAKGVSVPETDTVKSAIAKGASVQETDTVKSVIARTADVRETDMAKSAIAKVPRPQGPDTGQGTGIAQVEDTRATATAVKRAAWDIRKGAVKDMRAKVPPSGAMTTTAAIPPTGERAGTDSSGANGNAALTATVSIPAMGTNMDVPARKSGNRPCTGARTAATTRSPGTGPMTGKARGPVADTASRKSGDLPV
jgi:hypothetical protein